MPSKSGGKEFQSTLPQGERLWEREEVKRMTVISIHAPTRGATQWVIKGDEKMIISIHAPTRGATITWQETDRTKMISIHAPTRGATIFSVFLPVEPIISIHAPTRGATQNSKQQNTQSKHFNPRSHKGSDRLCTGRHNGIMEFQSTLPQGERRIEEQCS